MFKHFWVGFICIKVFYTVLSMIPHKISSHKLWEVAYLPKFQWISPMVTKYGFIIIQIKKFRTPILSKYLFFNNFVLRDRFHIQGGYVLEKYLKCYWKKKIVLDFFQSSDVLEMFMKKIIHGNFY